MSEKNLSFPLPIKIEEVKKCGKNSDFPLPIKDVKEEEDQKLFIDLDTEENSPEDIVIEWHLEIRRFFGSYSAASCELKLVSIMKEYVTAITERAIHFEHVIRLHEMVDNHMEHIYWFYRDSNICYSDLYLDYMEHIMTFYVNLTLRALLVSKKKIKVTQEMVNETTQKVIKRLSFYLLKSEYHIFHVLIRQTTTMVDGMIKDLMNILNSNICKQMFRNLYKHFLVLTPLRDMSDEAFCRAFILFENWKAFENFKHNEKIEKCMENIFNRNASSIRDNDFLRKILVPETSIMSELMKVMGCDPSITKAYFDHVKSKQKVELECIDDIGKLQLEDVLLSDTESIDEDDTVEFDTIYVELFDKIMRDCEYELEDVTLDCKNEKNSGEKEPEIIALDTDSDSDVEIVSITPSTKQVPNTTRRTRNPVTSAQTTTSFLDSISIDIDTARRKYGFRNSGNVNNLPSKKTTETKRTTTSTPEKTPEDLDVLEVIDDDIFETTYNNTNTIDKNKKLPAKVNIMQADTSGTEIHQTFSSDHLEDPALLNLNVPSHLSASPINIEISDSEVEYVNVNEKIADAASKVVEVSSSSNPISVHAESSPAIQEVSKTVQFPIDIQTNGKINHVCRCSQFLGTSAVTEKEDRALEIPPAISSTTSENAQLVVPTVPSFEECSKNDKVEGNVPNNDILDFDKVGSSESQVESKKNEVEAIITSEDDLEENSMNDSIITSGECSKNNAVGAIDVLKERLETKEAMITTENFPKEGSKKNGVEAIIISENVTMESLKNDEVEVVVISVTKEVEAIITPGDVSEEILNTNGVEATIASENVSRESDDVEANVSKEIQKNNEAGATITSENWSREAIVNDGNSNSAQTEVVLEEEVDESEEIESLTLDSCNIAEVVIETEIPEIGSEQTDIQTVLEDSEHNQDKNAGLEVQVEENCETKPAGAEPNSSLVIHLNALLVASENAKNGRVAPSDKVNGFKANGASPKDAQCRTNERTEAECGCSDEEKVGEPSKPLDTGQDLAVQSLDTGQFDADSPASPEDVPKSPRDKGEVMLRAVGEQHGEFGYPTPPGSEEEKDSDEHTNLIYSNILPTQTFPETPTFGDVKVEVPETVVKGAERLSDEETQVSRTSTPSLGKSYEQIVKDAVGSQNSTEDEDEDVSRKCKKEQDQDISFEEMEQFLKNCDNEDYSLTNRKKKKRPREKIVAEDNRSRKNSFTRSPKRVKINEKPETHFIFDEDSQDEKRNDYEYSSSDNEEIGSNRPRSRAKRRSSPMPPSKYLSKRNGATTPIPLSGRLSPDKPPPLKGILKRIEQKHTYHPLHPVDDEPETVVIVLHQRDVGRGNRGSVEVKVYRKTFTAFRIPFDDHKLCHHAFVWLDRTETDEVAARNRVSTRTRDFEDEMNNQLDKPMYKIVFDKQSPQLNSNDRKYYCDPSISSNSAIKKPESTLLESENEQGVKKKRSYVRRSTKNQSDNAVKPSRRGNKSLTPPESKMTTTPKKQREVSPKCSRLPVPESLEEALQAYADYYRGKEEDALLENSNKALSLHRIVKRFEQAMKQHRLGKPVDVEKLPVPDGYPPFPELHSVPNMASKSASRSTSENPTLKRKPYHRSSENFPNKKIEARNTER